MIVDASAIRVQCAARLIAYYCAKGKPCYFLKPLWDSPLFQCYWGVCEKQTGKYDRGLSIAVLDMWQGDLALCAVYPVLMLVRKHSAEEQLKILNTLEYPYGFNIFGDH